MSLIAITGGIGSGKSVVSRVLLAMGLPVYDCDREAKRLMNDDAELRAALTEAFGNEVYTAENGTLNRSRLASIIFRNDTARIMINSLVHPAVKRDMERWASLQATPDAWVETAILIESGMDKIADEAWVIEAPLETRIARVIRRDVTDRRQVLQRVAGQTVPGEDNCQCPIRRIINDDRHAIIPQIIELLQSRDNGF